MNDQDRANAFLDRLVKAITPEDVNRRRLQRIAEESQQRQEKQDYYGNMVKQRRSNKEYGDRMARMLHHVDHAGRYSHQQAMARIREARRSQGEQ